MVTIIPTVLASTKKDFEVRLARLLPIAQEIQVDIMDGRFVKSKSVTLDDIPNVSQWPKKKFEAHLMVKEPMRYIPYLAEKGFKRFIIHFESVWKEDISAIVKFVHRYKAKAILALNPETSVQDILPFASTVDGIVFLGVHPGQNGAAYVQNTPNRIKELRKKNKDIIIQVDGGMTPKTIAAVVRAGATRINSGSFISSAQDPKTALNELKTAIRGAV